MGNLAGSTLDFGVGDSKPVAPGAEGTSELAGALGAGVASALAGADGTAAGAEGTIVSVAILEALSGSQALWALRKLGG